MAGRALGVRRRDAEGDRDANGETEALVGRHAVVVPSDSVSPAAAGVDGVEATPDDGGLGPAGDDTSVANHTEDVESAMSRLGTGRFHWISGFICGLANSSDAVELLAVEYLLPNMDNGEDVDKGFLSAAVFIGMLLGGLAAGFLGDRIGRKPLLVASLLVNVTFGLAAALSPSWRWLVAFRICSGVGVGGVNSSVFTLYTEYLPVRNRGFFLTIVAMFWMVGSVTTASIAWITLGYLRASWRIFAALCAAPSAIACFLTLTQLPESPRFLANTRGDNTAAAAVLRRISVACGKDIFGDSGPHLVAPHTATLLGAVPSGGPSAAVSPIVKYANVADARSRNGSAGRDTLSMLFVGVHRSTTLLLVAVWFCLSFGWYGLAIWIPSLFKQAHMDLDVYQDAFLVAAATLPGNIVSALLMDRLGRKRMLSATMFASAVLTMLFPLAKTATMVVAVVCALNAVSIGGWNALDCLSTECFPTSLRGSALAVMAACGRIGSITGQFVFGALIEHDVTALMLTAGSMLMLGSLAGACLPRDTAGHKLADYA